MAEAGEEEPHENVHLSKKLKRDTDAVAVESAGRGGDRANGRGVGICRIVPAVLAAGLCDGRDSGNDHPDWGKYNPQGVEALGPVFLW